jgi:hypothetical protein
MSLADATMRPFDTGGLTAAIDMLQDQRDRVRENSR